MSEPSRGSQTTMSDSIATHSISSIRAGLASKKFSAQELARQALAFAEAENPKTNAYLTFSPERALAVARAVGCQSSPRAKIRGLSRACLSADQGRHRSDPWNAHHMRIQNCSSTTFRPTMPPPSFAWSKAGGLIIGKTNCVSRFPPWGPFRTKTPPSDPCANPRRARSRPRRLQRRLRRRGRAPGHGRRFRSAPDTGVLHSPARLVLRHHRASRPPTGAYRATASLLSPVLSITSAPSRAPCATPRRCSTSSPAATSAMPLPLSPPCPITRRPSMTGDVSAASKIGVPREISGRRLASEHRRPRPRGDRYSKANWAAR